MVCDKAVLVKGKLGAAWYVEGMPAHFPSKPPGNKNFSPAARSCLDRKTRRLDTLKHMLKDRADRGDSADVVKRVAEARLRRVMMFQAR